MPGRASEHGDEARADRPGTRPHSRRLLSPEQVLSPTNAAPTKQGTAQHENTVRGGAFAQTSTEKGQWPFAHRPASERPRAELRSTATRRTASHRMAAGLGGVAETGSVVHAYIWHRDPAIRTMVRTLRATPCGDPACEWCSEHQDPERELKRWFGLDGFRNRPSTEQGESVQREIVCTYLAGTPLLAVMPTGAGKSLCYQLPAVMRHANTAELTVVISPLVALMVDQVDGMRRRGIDAVVTLNSLLSAPERNRRTPVGRAPGRTGTEGQARRGPAGRDDLRSARSGGGRRHRAAFGAEGGATRGCRSRAHVAARAEGGGAAPGDDGVSPGAHAARGGFAAAIPSRRSPRSRDPLRGADRAGAHLRRVRAARARRHRTGATARQRLLRTRQ